MKEFISSALGFINEYEKAFKIVLGIVVFLVFFLIRNKLSNGILKLISKFIFRKKPEKAESFISTIKKPLSIFFIVLGLFSAFYINIKSVAVVKSFKIAVIIIICWAAVNYLSDNLGSIIKFKGEDDLTNCCCFIRNSYGCQ